MWQLPKGESHLNVKCSCFWVTRPILLGVFLEWSPLLSSCETAFNSRWSSWILIVKKKSLRQSQSSRASWLPHTQLWAVWYLVLCCLLKISTPMPDRYTWGNAGRSYSIRDTFFYELLRGLEADLRVLSWQLGDVWTEHLSSDASRSHLRWATRYKRSISHSLLLQHCFQAGVGKSGVWME